MKYFLPLILSVFIFSQAVAQITITLDDLVNVGDTVNIADVDNVPPGFDPGPPGASQHWDFSGFVMNTNYYLYFVDPASTPFAADFPTSNMTVVGLMDSAYIYTTRNSFVYQIDGLAGTYDIFENVVAPFEPPEIMFSFPLNYLDSMQQTIVVDVTIASPEPPADSLRLKVVSELDSKVDAWGTLTTPVNTYDVLRKREIRIATDTIWMKLLGFWLYVESNTDISINYKYMANDVGYPVMEFSVDTAGTEYSNINYHLDAGVGESELYLIEDLVFSIYPNPASTEVYCRMRSAGLEGVILIYDMTGRQFHSLPLNSTQQLKIDVSTYPPGLYQLVLKSDGKGVSTKKFVVR
ncbi:MAG: T9SS type A sorting domain-containing protein [Bacteroidetes bacterium]|nr:T9SS type A sorting domain-containing protein [Bacteroidota bacterium]